MGALLWLLAACQSSAPEQDALTIDLENLIDSTECDVELQLRQVDDGWKWFQPDDTVPFNGIRTTRYSANYQLKSKETFVDGELEGHHKEFYANGYMSREGDFHKSRKVGLWKTWRKNGQLSSKTAYLDDLKHGMDSSFYQNGQLMGAVEYEHGKKHGPAVFRYASGQTMMISRFENDMEQPGGQYWDEHGKPLDVELDSSGSGMFIVTVSDSTALRADSE